MKPFDITILTSDQYLRLNEGEPHVSTAYQEDLTLRNALESEGFSVARASWSDTSFDWTSTRFAIFRTTWDYFERFDEFIRWMGKVSRQTMLINPFKLVQWNLDKHYLLDLQRKGVPIVPTNFIKPLSRTTLGEELARSGWSDGAVLKPAISGSARHTYRLKGHNVGNHESIFQRLLKMESMMIQPFLESIILEGEVSLMVIDGKFTHAVRKKAKLGDFRVQSEFGGTVVRYDPTSEEIILAEKAIDACPFFPLYARVDLVKDDQGKSVVSELELIEPELFFRNNQDAATALAKTMKDFAERVEPAIRA